MKDEKWLEKFLTNSDLKNKITITEMLACCSEWFLLFLSEQLTVLFQNESQLIKK